MKQSIIFAGLIVFCIRAYEAQQIYSEPFKPLKDPWMAPSEGILVTEKTPVYIARKINGKVDFSKYDNVMKQLIDYAMTLPEYQRANVVDLTKNERPILSQPAKNLQVPAVLYPELIVVVAHDLYQSLNKDLWKAIPYMVAFYNGVDIVFRELRNPKIRINIAAIVVEDEFGVFEYLENSSVDQAFVKGSALDEGEEFWFKQKDTFPLDEYDAIVSMTLRGFCKGTGQKERCDEGIAGMARVSKMCWYSNEDEIVKKMAVAADDGHFQGVFAVAHELGHLLGVHHDNLMVASEKNGFNDIKRCNVSHANDNGFIMYPSTLLSTRNRLWSDCSLDYLQRFLRENNHTCLHNVPASGQYTFPRFLPGKVIGSFDNLCRLTKHGKACRPRNPTNTCNFMECQISETNSTCLIFPREWLYGTPCDENDSTKFCMFGQCISSNDFK